MTRAALLALLAPLPGDAHLPVSWLRERLGELEAPAPSDPAILDVAQLAARWRRPRSTVRGMLESGELPGGWKAGKAWRIRLVDVEAFEERQAQARRPAHPRILGGPGDRFGLRAVARG